MVSAEINGMDEFMTETGAAGAPEFIDLAHVAQVIPIHWDEAVAVVQEVIGLLSAGGNELPVPGLDAVLINASGAITLRRTGRGERGPVAAGRMLHSLLSSADVPVALRLFVSQANAPETYASLGELAAGLAYYGKPGRADLIRAVYERYAAANRSPAHHPPVPFVKPAPVEDARSVDNDRKKPSTRSNIRMPSWLVPAVATVVALGAVVWIAAKADFSSTDEAKVSTSQGPAEKSGPEARTKPSVARSNGPSPRGADGDRNPASQSKATSVVTNVPLEPSVTADDGVARIPLPTLPFALRAAEAAPEGAASFPAPSLVAEARTMRSEADRIYSGDDAEVRPPTMQFPQLPPPLMISSSRPDLVNRMEILVNADGSVERVRLVGSPARMTDMMLLSGAKLWKFRPAIKDGEPVRYRTFVTWSGFP